MERIPCLGALFALLLASTAPASGQNPADGLRLGAGDAVRVTVRDEPLLSGEFPVVAPGEILLPEIGSVAVADRPFGEVAREVRQRYERILVDAEIVLVPLLRIAVLGEVQQPGLLEVDPSQTITDVLALAGGVTIAGNPRDVTLVRDGRMIRLHRSSRSPVLTESLQSGDQLVVGRRGWMRENLPVVISAGTSLMIAVFSSLILR